MQMWDKTYVNNWNRSGSNTVRLPQRDVDGVWRQEPQYWVSAVPVEEARETETPRGRLEDSQWADFWKV